MITFNEKSKDCARFPSRDTEDSLPRRALASLTVNPWKRSFFPAVQLIFAREFTIEMRDSSKADLSQRFWKIFFVQKKKAKIARARLKNKIEIVPSSIQIMTFQKKKKSWWSQSVSKFDSWSWEKELQKKTSRVMHNFTSLYAKY